MNVPAKCNAKYVALCTLPNEIMTVNILLNRCGAYTDAGLKISTDLIFFCAHQNQQRIRFCQGTRSRCSTYRKVNKFLNNFF